MSISFNLKFEITNNKVRRNKYAINNHGISKDEQREKGSAC